MRFAALLSLSAALAISQTSVPLYEVFGKVTEPGIGPLSGVRLTVTGIGPAVSNNGVITDAQGTFRIRVDNPGLYILFPQKQEYSTSTYGASPTVVVDAAHPKAELNLEMQRLGKLSGRVVDEESREPVKGFDVYLMPRADTAVLANYKLLATTDANGSFTFENLLPGEYLATTRPPAPERQWALEVFKQEDVDATERGYEESFWPGGASLELALPVRVPSGGFAEIGTILARKTTLYRALIHLTGACAAATQVEIEIYRRGSKLSGHTYPYSCETDLLLLGLDRGSYLLHTHSPQASALFPLEVTDKNLKLDIPLRPNVVIEGQWIPAEGMGAIPDMLTLVTRQEVVPGVFVNGGTSERGKENRFRLSVAPDPQIAAIRSLAGSPYASEIRYNGSSLRNGLLEVSPGAAAHRLEVVLDNRPGSVSGDVTDGSRPSPGAAVILVPEAYRGEFPIGSGAGKRATADTNGHFDLAALIPGDYRILATRDTLSDAEVLMSLFRNAQKISVAASSSQSIVLRITNVK